MRKGKSRSGMSAFGQSGKHLPGPSITESDPERTKRRDFCSMWPKNYSLRMRFVFLWSRKITN